MNNELKWMKKYNANIVEKYDFIKSSRAISAGQFASYTMKKRESEIPPYTWYTLRSDLFDATVQLQNVSKYLTLQFKLKVACDFYPCLILPLPRPSVAVDITHRLVGNSLVEWGSTLAIPAQQPQHPTLDFICSASPWPLQASESRNPFFGSNLKQIDRPPIE
jgi:hypothetical protein